MRVFPDKGFTAYAAFLALLSGGLLITGWTWGLLISACLLAVALALFDYRRLSKMKDAVQVRVDAPPSRQRGEPIQTSLYVSNHGACRVNLTVRLCLPLQGVPRAWVERLSLGPGTGVALQCEVQTPVRGAYEFGDIWIRMSGPARFLQLQRSWPHSAVCKVYPDVKRVREYITSRRAHITSAPHVRRATLRGMGSEFERLRDYEPGDDIRRIDWRATAKHRKLISRNYEIESFRDVLVMVDRGRLMASESRETSKLDHAIDAALMISAVALDSGDHAGILVFDKDVSAYLPPRGAISYLPTLIESVYAVQPILEESDFLRAFAHLQIRLPKRSLIVVLTDVIDPEVSRSILEGVLALNKRHLVVFAALRTRAIYDAIAAPVADPLDPFRKAVAYRLVRERGEVIRRLRKGGVEVLDVLPGEITIPLVNKYVELREQNRL